MYEAWLDWQLETWLGPTAIEWEVRDDLDPTWIEGVLFY